jgi:hypothetical protein
VFIQWVVFVQPAVPAVQKSVNTAATIGNISAGCVVLYKQADNGNAFCCSSRMRRALTLMNEFARAGSMAIPRRA